uniref:Uncharacterized protein n=1 Tax=Triticum urartu TaxID=4572 RepID=A0A8R7PJJ1_TRIUA
MIKIICLKDVAQLNNHCTKSRSCSVPDSSLISTSWRRSSTSFSVFQCVG